MLIGIYNLKYLDLGLNKISKLDNNTVEYLVNLNRLHLDRNDFSKIVQTFLNSLLK